MNSDNKDKLEGSAFVLERHREDKDGQIFYEILGIFTSEKLALSHMESLPDDSRYLKYQVTEYPVNIIVPVSMDDVEIMIEKLCKQDLVEPLIDEEGNFHFRLTDLGKDKFREDGNGGEMDSTDRMI
jgi:hypothetical protein